MSTNYLTSFFRIGRISDKHGPNIRRYMLNVAECRRLTASALESATNGSEELSESYLQRAYDICNKLDSDVQKGSLPNYYANLIHALRLLIRNRESGIKSKLGEAKQVRNETGVQI